MKAFGAQLLDGKLLYSGPAVVEYAGISYRQMDYWTRAGWLNGHRDIEGSGYPRLYDQDECDVAKILGLLVEHTRIPPHIGIDIARALHAGETPVAGQFTITYTPDAAV